MSHLTTCSLYNMISIVIILVTKDKAVRINVSKQSYDVVWLLKSTEPSCPWKTWCTAVLNTVINKGFTTLKHIEINWNNEYIEQWKHRTNEIKKWNWDNLEIFFMGVNESLGSKTLNHNVLCDYWTGLLNGKDGWISIRVG